MVKEKIILEFATKIFVDQNPGEESLKLFHMTSSEIGGDRGRARSALGDSL